MIRKHIVKQIALNRMTLETGNTILRTVNEIKYWFEITITAAGVGACVILASALWG